MRGISYVHGPHDGVRRRLGIVCGTLGAHTKINSNNDRGRRFTPTSVITRTVVVVGSLGAHTQIQSGDEGHRSGNGPPNNSSS
jgi:hypothetical protein